MASGRRLIEDESSGFAYQKVSADLSREIFIDFAVTRY
jgi:hypothetical protein